MREWMRRNAVPLAVLVIAAPALVGVLLGLPLLENARNEPTPIEVAKGESVEIAGYTWQLVASGEFPHGDGPIEVPEGLAVTAAIIEVRPGPNADPEASCDGELVDATGADRRWPTLNDPRQFNYALGEDTTDICQLDGEPFDYELVFLTPEGTIGDAVVEISVGLINSELVRFASTD